MHWSCQVGEDLYSIFDFSYKSTGCIDADIASMQIKDVAGVLFYTIYGQKFGPCEGKIFIIVTSIYGLR